MQRRGFMASLLALMGLKALPEWDNLSLDQEIAMWADEGLRSWGRVSPYTTDNDAWYIPDNDVPSIEDLWQKELEVRAHLRRKYRK